MEKVLSNNCVSSVCRLCLCANGVLQNVLSCENDPYFPQKSLRQMIWDCTSIEISQLDGLPSNICLDCSQEVERIHNFRIRCLSSDVTLRKHFLIGDKYLKVENEAATADSSSEYEYVGSEHEEDSAMAGSVGMEPASPESAPYQDLPEVKEMGKLNAVMKDKSSKSNVGHKAHPQDNQNLESRDNSQSAPLSNQNTSASPSKIAGKSKFLNKSKVALRGIKKSSHNKARFVCPDCKKVFKHRYSLTRHIVSHIEEPLKCKHCKKSFWSRESFRRHEKTHSGQKPYKCQLCEKSYTSGTSYAAHVRKHTGERPYKCTECNESFYRLSSFDRHAAKHRGVRKYICEVCSASFWVADDLRAHVNRVH